MIILNPKSFKHWFTLIHSFIPKLFARYGQHLQASQVSNGDGSLNEAGKALAKRMNTLLESARNSDAKSTFQQFKRDEQMKAFRNERQLAAQQKAAARSHAGSIFIMVLVWVPYGLGIALG